MSKSLSILLVFSLILPLSLSAEDSTKSVHPISPVYEEMLANLMHSLNPKQEAILIGFDSPKGIRADSFSAELEKVARRLSDGGRRTFVLILMNGYLNRGWLESVVEDMGFQIEKVMATRELEFVEDAQGRQMVHLDMPQFRGKIQERLVREGMNPVSAYSTTDEAIQMFRRENQQILILSKR